MNFQLEAAQVFVPDGQPVEAALARTTHLGISAHQDDLEIMAIDGILKCFQQPDRWFTGVVVTNGSGSPRTGLYANTTDEEMQAIRVREQQKAAIVGDYAAQVLLGYPSSVVKDSANKGPVQDLITVLEATRPEVV
ncbi:MAG TPA: PIG-L family deacetylase, partial [Aggregatilineales bacterium]|nr:PIG-L family deacetylase [Aggregatilineales bacterium]